MNFARNRKGLSSPAGGLSALAMPLLLAGCFGVPNLNAAGGSAVRTEAATPRAAAVAEMRSEAAAGDRMPYPDAFQTNQTAALASRGEPLTVAEAKAVQAELTDIAKRRAATTDATEIAALEARARDLRRMMLRANPDPVRQ